MRVPLELKDMTFILEYNPNCPMRYLVRLCGPEKGYIDKKPRGETEDVLGYGRTFRKAAEAALREFGQRQESWLSAIRSRVEVRRCAGVTKNL